MHTSTAADPTDVPPARPKRSRKRGVIAVVLLAGAAFVAKKKLTKAQPAPFRPEDTPGSPPTDAEVERRRLIDDARAKGVDVDAAVEAAEKLGHLTTQPLADRLIDRRIATGYSVEEAKQMLLNDQPEPAPDPDRDH